MSKEVLVAKRYAKALFEIAHENNNVAQVEEELRTVLEVIDQNKDIQLFLGAPNIDLNVKLDVFKQAIQGKVSVSVEKTIALLIRTGRHSVMEDLVEAYVKIAGQALGQADATVVSAYALSQPEQELIAEHFGKLIGKKVRVRNVVNRSIIGGIQVRIGDRLYDGSLSGKLARLEKSLKQSQVL